MRILHVVSSLNPAAGGVTEFVLTMLRSAPAGVESEVVTLDDPKADFLSGLPVHALGPAGTIYAYTPRLVPWLRENRSRFDGVILHGLWQHCGFATLRSLLQTTPYVVFPHGMLDPYFKHSSPAKHAKKWLYWLLVEYWVLRKARRVLFTTEAESILAKQSFWLHRWRAEVVPFGTLPPPPDAEGQRRAFLDLHPELTARRFLLFLGRIHRKKGCDLLVEAFTRLAAEDPMLDLVMAGPDQQNWAAELKQLASTAGYGHRVHWPGMLTGDAKWGALRAAEVFALPSHQENFGIAVAEALACGTPVLLADKVNIAAHVASDGAGFVEPDTLEGTMNLLRRWIATSPAERVTLRGNARACFDRRFDLRANVSTILDLLRPEAGRTT